MKRQFLNFVLSALLLYAEITVGSEDVEYLKEKPSFLTPCHIHAKDNENCIAKAFENLFTNWKNGVPGLKGLSPLEPFRIKKLRFTQNLPNLADIQLQLRNTIVHGLSGTKVLKSTVDPKDYTFRLLLRLPSLKIESDYKLKGRLLLINLDGNGKSEMKLSGLEYETIAKAALKTVNGVHFFDVQSIQTDYKNIEDFNVNFSNLFNGDKELESSARTLFNENWREIFDLLRPAFSQTLDAIVLDRYKKIFNYIPADYFVDDLP